MAIELARRLLQGGVAVTSDVERALTASMTRRVPFLSAFAAQSVEAAVLVERETERARVPAVGAVRGLPAIHDQLPAGMCARLIAVPVRRDPRTGTVDVATADPFDPHVAEEFAFHLGSPVRILRATVAELRAALEELEPAPRSPPRESFADEHDGRTPAFGTPALTPDASRTPIMPRVSLGALAARTRSSGPPIPLVTRSVAPPPAGAETSSVLRPARSPVIELPEVDEAGQPVIELFRSKAPPPPPAGPIAGEPDLGLVLMGLATADRPDEVVEHVLSAMAPVAERVVVLAARADGFGGRAASHAVGDPESVRRLRVTAGASHAIETAVARGFFLGRLDADTEAGLVRALAAHARDAYLVTVTASGRPALLVAVAGMSSTFAASRRADEVARAAGEAIERILRARKRSTS